jgi:hypothetical protein
MGSIAGETLEVSSEHSLGARYESLIRLAAINACAKAVSNSEDRTRLAYARYRILA